MRSTFLAAFNRVTNWFCRGIGFFLILLIFSSIAMRSVNESFGEVASLGLALFGVLAALSSLAFSYKDSLEGDQKAALVRSGEHLLHASLLTVLVVVCRYLESNVEDGKVIETHGIWISYLAAVTVTISKAVFALAGLVATLAGAELMNEVLWSRREVR